MINKGDYIGKISWADGTVEITDNTGLKLPVTVTIPIVVLKSIIGAVLMKEAQAHLTGGVNGTR